MNGLTNHNQSNVSILQQHTSNYGLFKISYLDAIVLRLCLPLVHSQSWFSTYLQCLSGYFAQIIHIFFAAVAQEILQAHMVYYMLIHYK